MGDDKEILAGAKTLQEALKIKCELYRICLYHKDGATRTVDALTAKELLKNGWKDSPQG